MVAVAVAVVVGVRARGKENVRPPGVSVCERVLACTCKRAREQTERVKRESEFSYDSRCTTGAMGRGTERGTRTKATKSDGEGVRDE